MAFLYRRIAVDILLEKFICFGELIRFIRYFFLFKKDKGKFFIIKGRGKICYND